MVVSIQLKNIRQIGSFPQTGMKIFETTTWCISCPMSVVLFRLHDPWSDSRDFPRPPGTRHWNRSPGIEKD